MTKLYENIKNLCKERKMSILALERALNFPKNTISDWRNALPLCERVLIVAAYFDVSVDFLVGNVENRLSHKINYSSSTNRFIEVSEQLGLDENATDFVVKVMYNIKSHYGSN